MTVCHAVILKEAVQAMMRVPQCAVKLVVTK